LENTKPSTKGHRQRLRERFSNSGLQGFHDYEVVKEVLRQNAAALIFVHNHPSGNLNPSEEDIKITKELKDAASTIDVKVHDHLIIAGNDYYSFADNKLI